MNVRISMETTGLQAQLSELSALLEDAPKGLLHLVSRYLDRLQSDVVVGQYVTITGADGSIHLVCPVLLGADFERLLSYLRNAEELTPLGRRTRL